MPPFTDIATAVVGDQVHFQNVDVSLLGSNFTLGTLDDASSPTAFPLAHALVLALTAVLEAPPDDHHNIRRSHPAALER